MRALLADFGGINGVADSGDNAAYGAVLQEKLSTIRSTMTRGSGSAPR